MRISASAELHGCFTATMKCVMSQVIAANVTTYTSRNFDQGHSHPTGEELTGVNFYLTLLETV